MGEETHQTFLQNLAESESAVWIAAKWLHSFGIPTRINVSGRAPSHAEWEGYADVGDIEITERVEVKGLSASFTSKEDWPFSPHFLVCQKHSWDRATPKPHMYIYLSADRKNLAVVLGATNQSWYVEQRLDKRYNEKYDFYLCPMDLVKFFPLREKVA